MPTLFVVAGPRLGRMRNAVRAAVAERRDSGDLVDGEAASIEAFLAAFDRLAHPFDIDADPTHVTGSAIVVGGRGVVLLKHKRLGMWLQPGGHIDAGETPAQAALREAIEETGLDLELVDGELIHVDVHDGGRGHTHLDLRYLVRPVAGSDDTPRPPVGESQDVAWFDWDQAIRQASDERLRALIAALRPTDEQPTNRPPSVRVPNRTRS